jgi:hypothetical protein
MEIIIYDNRPYKEFNTATFSNYKKNEVVKAMMTSMNNQDIEGALFWSTELLCSGRLKDIWDIYLEIIGKNIRCGNPKMPIYIAKKFNNFKDIIMNGYSEDELEVRNSKEMRILIAEVTLVLCYSPKKPALQMLKIDKKNDFSYQILGKQLKADTMDWSKKFLYDEDPNEIVMAINEFVFHLNKKNLLKCCYWVDWLIEFDALCHKQKKPIVVKKRDFVTVDDKFKTDPIWILWDILLIEHSKNSEKHMIIKSLIELFSIKYNLSQKRKRRHLLYFAIELYTDDITMSLPILHHSGKIKAVLGQIGKFYQAIKKYEERPDVSSDKVNNLQKSIGKMNILYNLR